MRENSVAVHTYDGIYIEIHGSRPASDSELRRYFDDIMDEIEKTRAMPGR